VKSIKIILDTTALFNGRDFPEDFEIIVPDGVIEELIRWGLGERVETLLGTRIRRFAPSAESREKVRSISSDTGDIDRLSPTDIDVLALAIELDAPIISDDYSIQNVCRMMNIRCISLEESGIRRIFFWKFRCAGCGKTFERRERECDVCGHELRPFRYRSE